MRYRVAPSEAVHDRITRLSAGAAVRFCGVGGGAKHDATALCTLRRPPVIVWPLRACAASTVPVSASFSSGVSSWQTDRTSAAAPDTCGVAIDVPLNDSYVFPMVVERMLSPGAPR